MIDSAVTIVPVGDCRELLESPDWEIVVYDCSPSGSLRNPMPLTELTALGISNTVFIEVDRKYMYTVGRQFDAKFYEKNKNELEKVYSLLQDSDSREIFVGRIKSIITGNNEYLPLSSYPEYQHPALGIKPESTVVDGGIGVYYTPTEFFSKQVGSTGLIISFEPIPRLVSIAKKRLRKYKNVKIFQLALWDCETSLHLIDKDSASHVVEHKIIENNIVTCSSVRLDNFVSTYHLEVGTIKLDIEGVELHALKGAENIIRSKKPDLIICLYHNPCDMYEIPLYINSICTEYKFYIGNHHPKFDGTVLYATAKI
jgi:FkbM family methyltransferase